MSEATRASPGEVAFQEHADLVMLLLAHRTAIVEDIAALLNAQRRPAAYLQDGPLLSRHVEDCFFRSSLVVPAPSPLKGQLQKVHWSGGFKPCEMPGLHNDLVDPGQMVVRAFHLWQQTRWPGRNGRLRYAQTLFNLYMLRNLELLVMRLWDAGPANASDRLASVQGLLDALWTGAPADQPVLVRDARWLIPLAQSPTTEDLRPYFEVLEHIARSHSVADGIEIHKAAVQMAGGHLRSQLRHYLVSRHVALDEHSLVLSSRNSNALDFAMLVQGLVPLLEAYEKACDADGRLNLASAICQGLSADPELFVNRVDLLAGYTMIEHLFTGTDSDGRVRYSPMGLRHMGLLQEYARLIPRLSERLHKDCAAFRPVRGTYSPYGLIYGFSSNLTEHIALKTLQTDAITRFSLEDVFAAGGSDTLDWVNGWRKLPHIDEEVQRLFDYPQQFAQDIFARLERALSAGTTDAVIRTGRLEVHSDEEGAKSDAPQITGLPERYMRSYDAQFLHDRQEGTFAVTYETPGGWVAVTKDFLTDLLGAGQDVRIAGLPAQAAERLRLMCPGLVSTGH